MALLAEDTSALPFLDGALRRLLAEYPAADNGLSRSERQILEAVASGASTPVEAFRATARMEERPFMGDASWWILASALASAPHPLLAIETDATYAALPDGQMRLADTGCEVLAGRADHVTLNGIDRWLGGVHLTHGRWRRWLATGDKHRALREAQLALRKSRVAKGRSDVPFEWGAFVLVAR